MAVVEADVSLSESPAVEETAESSPVALLVSTEFCAQPAMDVSMIAASNMDIYFFMMLPLSELWNFKKRFRFILLIKQSAVQKGCTAKEKFYYFLKKHTNWNIAEIAVSIQVIADNHSCTPISALMMPYTAHIQAITKHIPEIRCRYLRFSLTELISSFFFRAMGVSSSLVKSSFMR